MSEYQYYEFVAIDRPLSASQMDGLRRLSTRATITRTRFVNQHEWGDFKGDPSRLMERYFDAFLYFANWGTRQVMLAMPTKGIDLRLARRCSDGSSARVHTKGSRVVLELSTSGANSWPVTTVRCTWPGYSASVKAIMPMMLPSLFYRNVSVDQQRRWLRWRSLFASTKTCWQPRLRRRQRRARLDSFVPLQRSGRLNASASKRRSPNAPLSDALARMRQRVPVVSIRESGPS